MPMSEFAEALEYVHSTLRELQARGVKLTASIGALESLSVFTTEPLPVVPERAASAPVERVVPTVAPVRAAPRLPALPPLSAARQSKAERLAALRGPALVCTKCPHLAESRTQVVFGVGNPEAELMFVGEAPGEDEDRQGEPFVGKAGQLLTKIIEVMGFPRESVYIANVLKCRPNMPPDESGNRKPTGDEMGTCLPYLEAQIEIIQPKVLVALGNTAMEGLVQSTVPMAQLRGRWHEFRGIPMMATYHPAYLLRNQSVTEKRKVWEDMLLVLGKLGRPVSEKQQAYFTKG